MTDLDKHYKPGMRLSRLLARQSAQKDFLDRALAPFPVGDLRDVFVCVLRDFSDDFLAEDTTKVIELPLGLRLVSMVEKTDVGPFEEMIIYRECDLPETPLPTDPVRQETQDVLPVTHMAAESFILRNIELWKYWIKESVNEQGEEAATKQWFHSSK